MVCRSSRFAGLQSVQCAIWQARICTSDSNAALAGDAMGMNMVSKGVQHVLDYLLEGFPDMDVIGVSGNRCLFVMLLFSLVVIGTRSNLIAG